MSLPKLFERIFWHNNTTPAVNETNLNAMSKGLSDVDDRLISLGGLIMETVPEIQQDMEILGPAVESIDNNVARAEAAAESAEQYAEEIAPPIEVVKDYADIITVEDAINKAVKDLKVKVDAVQDLHGYDKPWVGGAGKNKLDVSQIVVGSINTSDGSNNDSLTENTRTNNYIPMQGGTEYTISGFNGGVRLHEYASDKSYLGNNVRSNGNFTTNANCAFIRIAGTAGWNTATAMIRLASVTDPTWEPYANICPITGHSEAKVTRAGKNLFDGTLQQGYYDNVNFDLTSTSDARYRSMKVWLKAGQYVISWGVSINLIRLIKDNTYTQTGDTNITSYTVTLTKDGYLGLSFRNNANTSWDSSTTIQVEIGSTATAYEPYQGHVYTIDLDGTRYGGVLDVDAGTLTLTHVFKEFTSSDATTWYTTANTSKFFTGWTKVGKANVDVGLSCISSAYKNVFKNIEQSNLDNGEFVFNTNRVSSGNDCIVLKDTRFNTVEDFKASLTTPLQLVYELATPQTITLTPTEVDLLLGYNTLCADTGDLSLTYDASGVLRIANAKLDIDTFKSVVAASSDFADFKTKVAAL